MTVVLHVYILYCSVSFSICLSHMQDVETVWFILHPWHGSPHLWLLHLPLVCTVELIALHWKKGPHYIIVRSRVCDLRSLLQWYCALTCKSACEWLCMTKMETCVLHWTLWCTVRPTGLGDAGIGNNWHSRISSAYNNEWQSRLVWVLLHTIIMFWLHHTSTDTHVLLYKWAVIPINVDCGQVIHISLHYPVLSMFN